MPVNERDQELLALWRDAQFKGDLMCALPLPLAARLVDLVMQHEPPVPPCGQGNVRRRAFRYPDLPLTACEDAPAATHAR